VGVDFAVACVDHQPLIVRIVNQNLQQFFPNALVTPTDKTAVRVAPAAIVRRQIAPRRARSQYPEHCIDKSAVIFGNTAPRTPASRSMRLQQNPDFIR
jgi:hypothetical protein